MPLYDLRCLSCKHEFSEMVSYSRLGEVECPQCGSKEKEFIYKAHVKGPVAKGTGSPAPKPSSGFT